MVELPSIHSMVMFLALFTVIVVLKKCVVFVVMDTWIISSENSVMSEVIAMIGTEYEVLPVPMIPRCAHHKAKVNVDQDIRMGVPMLAKHTNAVMGSLNLYDHDVLIPTDIRDRSVLLHTIVDWVSIVHE